MNELKLGWLNITPKEKMAMIAAILISVGLSYQAVQHNFGVISNQAIGPLILTAFAVQSLFIVGLIRGRSRAMNGMFVELMKELSDAKERLGEDWRDTKTHDLVKEWLGDLV